MHINPLFYTMWQAGFKTVCVEGEGQGIWSWSEDVALVLMILNATKDAHTLGCLLV